MTELRCLILKNQRGFTLFELLAVMLIMAVLATIAVPSYKRSQIKAQETVLAEDLFQMRRAIDGYFSDHARYPDSLDQLVENKYLRGIPRDPFTRTEDSWKCVAPEPGESGAVAEGGCFDVRSGSDLIGLNDTPYQDW